MNLDEAELKAFLMSAKHEGYAGGNMKSWTKQPDGSTTIGFELGSWRMDDNFFGGEPYGGREVVFHDGKPAWLMVYYGWVAPGADPDVVYGVLREALKRLPPDCPLRGPAVYKERGLTYLNTWEGGVERFSGREEISGDGELLYEASYLGGWVDARRGD